VYNTLDVVLNDRHWHAQLVNLNLIPWELAPIPLNDPYDSNHAN